MGRTASSSKTKSSKKKKTSKISSQGRRSKRSKRNNKSKKLLRREDSSSYSDDDSTSSMPVLSSSSEDDYMSRRARSRKKTNVKRSKKRAPRRSPSRERSKDAMRVKKSRGAKRKHRDSETTKKRKYKKSRRDTSVSCSSCSTSSSGESEFERRRGRSREKRTEKGDSGRPRSGHKRRKNRSLSCSSLSRLSDASGDETKEKLAVEVNARRLRSVITIAKRAEERDENEGKKDDVHTDEIVYEHDDYPSRSNDSNDGANKRELVHQSCVESNERIRVGNVLGQEDSDSKLTTNEFMISTTNPTKENESGVLATVDGSSGGQDLESILRQKALENLKRFRGGSQTIEKPCADEFVQSKSPKQDNSVSVGVAKFSGPKLSRDSSISMRTEGKILDGKESNPTRAEGKILDGKESLSTRGGERKIPDGRNRGIEPGSSQSESSLSKSRQESLVAGPTLKPEPVLLTSPNTSSVVNKKSSVSKGAGETSQTGGEISGISRGATGVNDGHGSTGTEPVSRVEPSSEEQHGSREGQDQVKDSSQFQQKTMSVMRGGEMVQVSYKVYIPKKVPALARRQLQR